MTRQEGEEIFDGLDVGLGTFGKIFSCPEHGVQLLGRDGEFIQEKTVPEVDVEGDDIKFIHATTSRGVLISSLREGYWNYAFVKAMRIL